MIKIENLSPYQVEILDTIWSCETEEEFLEFYDKLDDDDQKLADTLMRMVVLASCDEEDLGEMKESKQILKKYMIH